MRRVIVIRISFRMPAISYIRKLARWTDPGFSWQSLDNPNQPVRLVQSDAKAEYEPPRESMPGYLFWVRYQTLVAQRFDPKSRRLEGNPLVVADGIASGFAANARRAAYSVSTTGVLAYRGGGNVGFELAWGQPRRIAGSHLQFHQLSARRRPCNFPRWPPHRHGTADW